MSKQNPMAEQATAARREARRYLKTSRQKIAQKRSQGSKKRIRNKDKIILFFLKSD